jgi:uncharacterized membrane protein SirB2
MKYLLLILHIYAFTHTSTMIDKLFILIVEILDSKVAPTMKNQRSRKHFFYILMEQQ